MNVGGYSQTSQPERAANEDFASATLSERSAASILTDLWQNTEHLLQQEVALLRADLDRRTDQAKRDVVELSVAGGVAYAGALALVASIVLALSRRLAPWLAALLVGALAIVAGYAMIRHSVHKLAGRDLVPRASVESMEITTHEIKEALR